MFPKASTRAIPYAVCALLACALAVAHGAEVAGAPQPQRFGATCALCHGGDAEGTDRAPSLVGNKVLRGLGVDDIAAIIAQGRGGMPPFASLPPAEIQQLAAYVRSLNADAFDMQPAGDVANGRRIFFGGGHCADCHSLEGRGGTNGPDLSGIAGMMTLGQLGDAIRHPHFWTAPGWGVVTVTLNDDKSLRGFARNQTQHSLDLQTFDGRLLPLSDTQYRAITADKQSLMPPYQGSAVEFRDLIAFLSRQNGVPIGENRAAQGRVSAAAVAAVVDPKPGDWPTYSGNVDGNRFSSLSQINAGNVSALRPAWVRPLPYEPLETTPLVMGGIMYVTGPNQIYALDGRTGSQIWGYSRPRSDATTISSDAAKGAQRGVAVLGDRLFFITDNAHLICLQRVTGALLWDVAMPDPGEHGRYGGTSAPLIAGSLVIAGVSGGDEGIRGFVAAYEPVSGRRVWRFWTVPKPADPTYDSWHGDPQPQGGATWTTGSYDSRSGLLYVAVGNPYPDTDGDRRLGDDLYTESDLALDARTGKLRWYFQFTPHDLHDWDAEQPLALVDAKLHGRAQQLLLHANRNGFFYVLDRTNGKLLQATRFVDELTWAKGIAADGRPILLPANETTLGGVKTCPAVRGAANWYSTSYDAATGLYYVMSVEDCSIYRKAEDGGYTWITDPLHPSKKVLRAIRVDGGGIAWQVPLLGAPDLNYSGAMATAGGVVFFGETSGGIAAVAARDGRYLWHFEANQPIKGSPMTYAIDGRQYVAIAAGSNILAFTLAGGQS
ncbi:MAG TPA: PQQ-binding-like beta-propeller repeat protein [Steroidobacteraceae bacterium]